MQGVATRTYAPAKILPAIQTDEAPLQLNVALAPSTTFTAGILARIGDDANDVQTVTIGGTPTGGTFTLSGSNPLTGKAFTTAAIAYNAAASAVASAVSTAINADGVGSGNSDITVTGGGGALPGAAVTLTFSGAAASIPVPLVTADITSLTGGSPTKTIAHTTVGRSANTCQAYDGSGNALAAYCILPWDCVTDQYGRIALGDQSSTPQGEFFQTLPCYFSGVFKRSDLPNLDADAITDFAAKAYGNSSTGLIAIPSPLS